jgi:hypothetical protein
VPFVVDLHAFCASGGFVSVLAVGFFCSLSGIIRFFVHPLSWLSCRTRAPGALEVRLWEFAFYCFPCIQWIVCVSCFFVCSFYGFLIFRLFVHPFDSFSFSGHCLGTSFFVERWTENLLGCVSIFRPSFVLVGACENCSGLNGCTKTLTFEKQLFACVSGEPAGCTKLGKSAIAPTCSRGPFRTVLGPMSCAGRLVALACRRLSWSPPCLIVLSASCLQACFCHLEKLVLCADGLF